MTCDISFEAYRLLFQTYENFNGQSLIIKGWSVTVGLAAILAIYSDRIGKTARPAIWLAALSTIPFWIMDAYWKSFQNAYLTTLLRYETHPACQIGEGSDVTFVAQWRVFYHWTDFLTVLHLPSVALPHAFVLGLGLYMAIRHPPAVGYDVTGNDR